MVRAQRGPSASDGGPSASEVDFLETFLKTREMSHPLLPSHPFGWTVSFNFGFHDPFVECGLQFQVKVTAPSIIKVCEMVYRTSPALGPRWRSDLASVRQTLLALGPR